MEKIKITCDSTCDLTQEIYDKYNISVMPLTIILGETTYKDGVSVNADEVFGYVNKNKLLPKTSAVSVGEYIEFFKQFTEEGYSVIHINLSSELSSSYQNACIASKEFDGKVIPFDSKNLSSGSGYLVLEACEMANKNLSTDDIINELCNIRGRMNVSFVLQTLEYMKMGGRCSSIAALGANALKLRPEIVVTDGKMSAKKKYRGDIHKSLQSYVLDKLKDTTDINDKRIFITHSCKDQSIAKEIEEMIANIYPFKEVIITKAGCTISSHCGEDCLGLLFQNK